MSCICEYFVHSSNSSTNICINADSVNCTNDSLAESRNDNIAEMKSTNSSVSATDLATAQAEIWVLKKAISENRVSIENLENLVKTIIEKQNVMLTEMYRLKRINVELRDECRMQRDYHTMERNAMVRELHDVKTLLCNRSKLLEETIQKNTELMSLVHDADEKVYLMGMKYLKIKHLHSALKKSKETDQSEESDQTD